MRIGMLADIYKPHISGVTQYIDENRRVLENLGHDVTVFTFGNPSTPLEQGVIRSPGLPVAQAGLYLNIRYSSHAKKTLLQMDVVHCHHPFISGRLALNYCRPLHIPIVFTNHTRYDLYLKSYLPVVPDLIGDTFLQMFLQSFCRSVDAVISPSHGMKTVLEELGVDAPIRVIPNGVDLSRFSNDVVPFPRSDYGFNPENLIYIYTGRLAPEKNLPFLIQCFARLVNEHPNAKLILAGTGPQEAELQREVTELGLKESVTFTGFIDYSNINRLLTMADVFVTASSSEVHPLSVIEAMASGLPVVGIISPGVSDTVEDGLNGLLTIMDEKSFTARMARLIDEPDLRLKMGEAARKGVECCDLAITSRQVESLYAELVQRARLNQHGLKYGFRKAAGRWRA